jgi:N-methylhydantoinase A
MSDLDEARADFDRLHEEIFAFQDPNSQVQFVSWRADVSCKLREQDLSSLSDEKIYDTEIATERKAYFEDTGIVETKVVRFRDMKRDLLIDGPAIVESPLTTVVVDPGATVIRKGSGSLVITP